MCCAAVSATAQSSQQPNLPLLNSSVQTLTGTYNAQAPSPFVATTGNIGMTGGCNFTFTPPKGQMAIEARFVQGGTVTFDQNTGTCQGQFEVGQPQEAVLAWDAQQLRNAQTKTQTFGTAASSSVSVSPDQAAGYYESAGYLYAYFTDPVGLTVNSIYVGLNPFYWTVPNLPPTQNPNPVAVTNDLTYYLSASGWSQTSASLGTAYFPWFYLQFYIDAIFTNSVFPACLGGTVTATYNTASVFGYYNGQIGSGGSWTLAGPVTCIYLLSPGFRVVQTLGP